MMDDYENWSKEIGCKFHVQLEIKSIYGSEERGIFTKQTVSPNSAILSIPFQSVLSLESVAATGLSFLDISLFREDDILAITLLHEKYDKGEKSFWAKHISMLPISYDSIVNYDNYELDHIVGSNLFTLAHRWKSQIEEDFNQLTSNNDIKRLGEWFNIGNQ